MGQGWERHAVRNAASQWGPVLVTNYFTCPRISFILHIFFEHLLCYGLSWQAREVSPSEDFSDAPRQFGQGEGQNRRAPGSHRRTCKLFSRETGSQVPSLRLCRVLAAHFSSPRTA